MKNTIPVRGNGRAIAHASELGGTLTSPNAAKSAPIQMALERNAEQLGQLLSLIADLEERLGPVSSPRPCDPKAAELPPTPPGVLGSVEIQGRTISAAIERLESIRASLQICMTASGHIQLFILDPRDLGMSRVEVCNGCATGRHLAPEHVRGEIVATYLSVDCPLCGRTALKTRARVRRSQEFVCASPLAGPKAP